MSRYFKEISFQQRVTPSLSGGEVIWGHAPARRRGTGLFVAPHAHVNDKNQKQAKLILRFTQ